MGMKTDEVSNQMLNNSEIKRDMFIGPSYCFESETIFYRMRKWNTECAVRNEPEIIVENVVSLWTPKRFLNKNDECNIHICYSCIQT